MWVGDFFRREEKLVLCDETEENNFRLQELHNYVFFPLKKFRRALSLPLKLRSLVNVKNPNLSFLSQLSHT